jgi:hypothetical protein
LMLWQDFVANVLYPLALSYPYFGSINFIHDTDTLIPHVQEKLDVFPKNYDGRFIRHFSYPEAFGYQRSMEYFSGIQVKPFARVALDQWLMAQGINRPYITVTVRNRKARDERRNTDEDLFLSVLEQNLPSEVSVVVVPDTENLALRSLSKGSYHISYQASISIFSRVALYDGARLNLFSANGPASICYFLRNCKFIVFGYGISDSAMGNIDVMQSIGLKHGEQFFCDNGSRGAIIWGESRSDLAFHVRRMLST